MRRFVDLHTHSTASDGTLAPRDLVALAEQCRLAAVALTDHDTVGGLAEAAAAARGCPRLHFVAGIEVSAAPPPSGTLHILGLGIDAEAPSVRRLAEFLRTARAARNPKIVARLQSLGVGVNMDDVLAETGKGAKLEGAVVGRLHIARAIVRRGNVRTPDEAFARYLGKGRPAYVDRERLGPRETIAAIREGGGVAALAHPIQLGCANRAQFERLLRELRSAGLEAVEAYHGDHTPEQTRLYIDVARRLGLWVCGGSDFHGAAKPGVKLGMPRVSLGAISEGLAGRLWGGA